MEKIKIEVDNDTNWNEFLFNQKEKQLIPISHNPSLKEVLKRSFNFECHNYLISSEDKVMGVFPVYQIKNKKISVPHFSYGDIICDYKKADIEGIRNELIGFDYEIRSFNSFSKHVDASKVMCYLDLMDSKEAQWDFWKSKLRSQIRKGIKNGVEVKVGGKEYLMDFYKVYSKNMRDLGSPVLSLTFFKNILNFYDYGEAKIFIAHRNNFNLAVGLVLTYQNFAEVCWASSLKEYNSLNANVVLYWEMIKYTVNNQYKYFSFGRSTKDSTTHRFKEQWSPNEKQLFFNYSVQPKIDLKKYAFLPKLWKQLPISVANKLGPYISKRIF